MLVGYAEEVGEERTLVASTKEDCGGKAKVCNSYPQGTSVHHDEHKVLQGKRAVGGFEIFKLQQ